MAGPAVLKIDIVANAKGANAEFARTEGQLSSLGGTASKAGALVKGGVLAIGAAAVLLGKQAFDAASAVQQSFGAVESVYGKHAGLVKDLANNAATSVGLAKSQYADLAALLGSQLTNMGRSQQQAANETENLIALGADLAATYGGSVADAVSAVSSVLKGETDPIERYGISIKQSDINARLAAKGLDDLQGAALKQATATAALGLVTEQSTKAQGAFAREADTAAGQQARLSANVENLKARLGEGLLPIVTNVAEFINTRVIPGASAWAATLSRELGPTISQVGAFIQTKLIPAARSVVEWFVEKIVPNIRAYVVPVLTQLKASFGGISNSLDDNSEGLGKLARFVGTLIEWLSKLAPIVGKIVVVQLKVFSAVVSGVITTVSTLVNWIDSAIHKVQDLANAIKNNPISKGLGAIGGLFGAGPLAGGVGAITRGLSPASPAVGPITTAAAGGTLFAASTYALAGSGGPAIVDARRFYTIDASGSLDPVATAERIRDVLRKDDVRRGRASSFAPATGWLG